tara:strand:+ start:50 stop:526 length:477 start_codon:yes stop_codon:yes gene_type:complete
LRPHYAVDEGWFDNVHLGTSADLVMAVGYVLGGACIVGGIMVKILAEGQTKTLNPTPPPLIISAASIACYVILFLPTCGIIQHGMVQKGGDRYAYIPYLALIPLVAAGVNSTLHFLSSSKSKVLQILFSIAALSVVSSLSIYSSKQVCIWCNDESMYR